MNDSAKLLDLAISKKVRELMDAEGLEQKKFAQIFDISPSSLHNKLVSGKGAWRASEIVQLMAYFGVTAEELLYSNKEAVDSLTADIYSRADAVSKEFQKVAEKGEAYLPKSKKSK